MTQLLLSWINSSTSQKGGAFHPMELAATHPAPKEVEWHITVNKNCIIGSFNSSKELIIKRLWWGNKKPLPSLWLNIKEENNLFIACELDNTRRGKLHWVPWLQPTWLLSTVNNLLPLNNLLDTPQTVEEAVIGQHMEVRLWPTGVDINFTKCHPSSKSHLQALSLSVGALDLLLELLWPQYVHQPVVIQHMEVMDIKKRHMEWISQDPSKWQQWLVAMEVITNTPTWYRLPLPALQRLHWQVVTPTQ